MDRDLLSHSLRPSQATAILGASGMGNNVGTLTGNLPPLHLLPAGTPEMNLNLVPNFSSSSSDDDSGDDGDEDGSLDADATNGSRLPLGSSSSEEEEWGTIRGGNFHISLSSSSSDDQLAKSLFIPESNFQIASLQAKPLLPYLKEEELPPGSGVWVVDEDDVKTILGINWDRMYHTVCNGRLRGVVKRHSGKLTLVEFRQPTVNMVYTLSVPCCCLSLTAITPYESMPQADCNIMSSGYGALGPRSSARSATVKSGTSAAQGRRRRMHQDFYEAPSLFKLSSGNGNTELAAVLETFLDGKVAEALIKLESCFDALKTDNERADFFTLRSRLLLFLGRAEDALKDAEVCCRLEPQWIRGYLSAARVHSYLGDFKAADNMISRASVLMPNSAALQNVESLNRFMSGVAQTVRNDANNRLGVRLDEKYRKKLIILCDADTGSTLWTEDIAIASTVSLFDTPNSDLCSVCFAPADDTLCSSSSPPLLQDDMANCTAGAFCSEACRKRGSLLALEFKHSSCVSAARTILRNKAATTVNPLPLELANLTIRLFFIVLFMHRRLVSQARHARFPVKTPVSQYDPLEAPVGHQKIGEESSSPPSSARQISLDAVLERFNVYPLVSCLDSTRRDRGLLQLLYDAIAAELKEDDRQVFDVEFFERLYDYVYTYFVNAELPGALRDHPLHVFFVGSLVSAVSRFERPAFRYNGPASEDAIPEHVGRSDGANVQLWRASEEGCAEETLVPNCVISHCGQLSSGVTALPRLQGVHSPNATDQKRVLRLVTTSVIKAGDDLCIPPFVVDLT